MIDGRTGKVVIASGTRQRVGAPLATPKDARFAGLAGEAAPAG